jgi:hypothetical protein
MSIENKHNLLTDKIGFFSKSTILDRKKTNYSAQYNFTRKILCYSNERRTKFRISTIRLFKLKIPQNLLGIKGTINCSHLISNRLCQKLIRKK